MTKPIKGIFAGLLAAAALLVAERAHAETCTISASSMAFGVYDPLAASPLDTTSTIQVTCTSVGNPKVKYDVSLDKGQAGSYNPRAMTDGSSQLNYNLYTNASRTTIWGDGKGGTAKVSAKYDLLPVGSTQTDSYTVYGRVFAGQTVTVGAYLDTITATVKF